MQQCVSHVKVGSVFYRYNRPLCVDQFIDLPLAAANDMGIRSLDGECQRKWNAIRGWRRPTGHVKSNRNG